MKELVFTSPFPVTAFLMDIGFVLLQWPERIESAINDDVVLVSEAIRSEVKGLRDVVPAYSSIGVFYDHSQKEFDELVNDIKELQRSKEKGPRKKIIEVPVCYDIDFAIDIDRISKANKISKEQIVSLHSTPIYKVCFLGFLPGFVYLSGLDPLLNMPRLKLPRKKIPKGAVAIGGTQTGIYPLASPGGWNIIGRCPLRLFDTRAETPSKFTPGDHLKFSPISLPEFHATFEKEHQK
jgi:inhibitor of KinA